mgnify:CR=1 FL=1
MIKRKTSLAAKTASNTEELGTAMQRTASIAASAGMSFEGTAAFLAQAIETTREPAENLGTAMKTIVARFTEIKNNPLEMVEVEGEELSYNKVDTALQSIGVSLNRSIKKQIVKVRVMNRTLFFRLLKERRRICRLL